MTSESLMTIRSVAGVLTALAFLVPVVAEMQWQEAEGTKILVRLALSCVWSDRKSVV